MKCGEASAESLSQRVPGMTPRTAPMTLDESIAAHPNPFICDLRIDRDQLSEIIPHVSNIEYVRWLDRASELHADACGWTRQRLLEENIMWFVGRHEIDYLAEAWPDDELIIATWVRDFSRVKSWRDYVVYRPSDKTIVCRAATLWVLVSLETHRPVRIPIAMRDDFAAMGGAP